MQLLTVSLSANADVVVLLDRMHVDSKEEADHNGDLCTGEEPRLLNVNPNFPIWGADLFAIRVAEVAIFLNDEKCRICGLGYAIEGVI